MRFSRRLAVVAAAWGAGVAQAIELPLGEGTVLRFADVREGVAAITQARRLYSANEPLRSPGPAANRARRQRTRNFWRSWPSTCCPGTTDDIAAHSADRRHCDSKLRPWKLRLPPVVLLVKTSGREEAGAAYCRGPAIVLPQNMIDGAAALGKSLAA